jgi:hypothetical protein
MHLLGSRTLVALGLLLAMLAGAGAVRNLWLWRTGATVQGVVVRQVEELAADWTGVLPGPLGARQSGIQTAAATRVYRAVVEFQAGGAAYEVMAGARATVHLYPLGSKVDVVFPRGRPERARLRPELPDFWVQAGLLLLSTLVGAGSGYTWWKLALRRAARGRVVKAAG